MADLFADYLATGTTKGVAFVLVIEGCEYVFASDNRCEQVLADGRTIVRGLSPENLGTSETAYLAGAELELSMPTLSITETAGLYRDAATRAFTAFVGATAVSWISAAVIAADTTITLGDTAAGIAIGDFIHAGTETWKVVTIPTATTITVQRAQWGTTAQAFAVESRGTSGIEVDLVPVHTEPACYAGRRCWLYGRGIDELTTASATAGTLLWRGVLTSDPELAEDGLTWDVSLSSRLALFDAKIGSEKSASSQLRGIYYPDRSPFAMAMFQKSGAVWTDPESGLSATVTLSGFFETQAVFCGALTTAVSSAMTAAGISGTCEARPSPDGETWDLYYRTPAASPRWLSFVGGSPVDGWFNSGLYNAAFLEPVASGTVAASSEYRASFRDGLYRDAASLPASDIRRVPRAAYDRWYGSLPTTTWPLGRWYLDRVVGYAVSGSMVITPPKIDGSGMADALPTITIVTRDVGGWVEAADDGDVRPDWVASGGSQPTIDLALRLNGDAGMTLAGFRDALVSTSPGVCNLGLMPFITSDDVADWTTTVTLAAMGRDWLLSRDYVFGKPQKLIDIIKHECRAYGLYLRLDSDGKIAVKQLAQDVDTPPITVDASRHMPDGDSFGAVRLAPDGMIGAVLYKAGYDSREDKHAHELTFQARGVQATAKGKAQTLEIAPMVNPVRPVADFLRQVQSQARSLLTLYGSRRYVYDVPVSMHCHSLRIGDGALLTLTQLPYLGQRGSTTAGTGLAVVRGTVIARTWSYGAEPRGRLSFMVHGLEIAGYAPTARASTIAASGGDWDVTCLAAQYGPGGTIKDVDYFLVGDRVSLDEWDSATPASYDGRVKAVDSATNKITVTFDGVFPGAATATWNLRFADSNSAALTTTQKRYAFIANSVGAITYDVGSRTARIFA